MIKVSALAFSPQVLPLPAFIDGLSCFVVHSTRRFVLSLVLCDFVLVFFRPFSIAITSLGEERVNLSAFRTFVRFAIVWFCLFPLPLGVWKGLWLVILALPGFFSYLFFVNYNTEFVCHLPTHGSKARDTCLKRE